MKKMLALGILILLIFVTLTGCNEESGNTISTNNSAADLQLYQNPIDSIENDIDAAETELVLQDSAEYPLITTDELINTSASENEIGISQNGDSSYEEGTVTILSNGIVYEPGIHLLHGATNDEDTHISATGIPFEFWLHNNMNSLTEISYNNNLHVEVDGEFGQIVTHQHQDPWYHGEFRLIGLTADSFNDGIANIHLPDENGVYLVYVDVTWSGGGIAFTQLRYVFKIVK